MLHPRVLAVQRASVDIGEAISEALKKHRDLTHLELQSILLQEAQQWLKYAIRDERHPNDPNKRGGEA